MIGERVTFVEVTPRAEQKEKRNPPRPRGPEEEGETVDEREHAGDKGVIAVEDDVRAGEGGDGHRPHVDPVRRREFVRVNLEEHETMDDERDDQNVEHAAEQVEAKHGEKEGLLPRADA